MYHSDNYINYLLEDAQTGSNEAFLEICDLLLEDVFSLSFQLLDNYDQSFSVTKKTFAVLRSNLRKFSTSQSFSNKVREITITLCVKHLNENDGSTPAKVITYQHMANVHGNTVEEAFTGLSFHQKLAVVIATKLNRAPYKLKNLFGEMGDPEINDLYYESIYKLMLSSEDSNLQSLSNEDFQNLISSSRGGESGSSEITEEVMESFQKFNAELEELFENIKADPSLLEEIKEKYTVKSKNDSSKKSKSRKPSLVKKLSESSKKKVEGFIENKKEIVSEKKLRKIPIFGHLNRSIILMFFFVLLAASIAIIIELNKSNTPWEIKSEKGIHTIYGEPDETSLYEGDKLTTSKNSILSIDVENLGTFKVTGESVFTLEKGYASDNIIDFEGSFLEFKSFKKPFIIDKFKSKPALQIKHGKLFINIEVADITIKSSRRSTELYVREGWVKIQNEDDVLFIGNGYSLNLRNKISVPYHRETSDAVQKVANDPNLLSIRLESMLSQAQDKDVLTLWHLLALTREQERYLIVERIWEIMPLLEKTTVEELAKLDDDAVKFVLELIKWGIMEGVY